MAPVPKLISIRPTAEDGRIVSQLRRKLGISASAVIRLGLRRLAEKEKVKVKA